MSRQILNGREIIIEFHPIGHVVRVSAMDVATLTEVSIQGPVSAPRAVLEGNAVRRLEYVMRKKGLV